MEQTSYIKSLYIKIKKAWDSKLVIILPLAFWKLLYFFFSIDRESVLGSRQAFIGEQVKEAKLLGVTEKHL